MVRSADDFLAAYRRIRSDYETIYRPLIDAARQRFAQQIKANSAGSATTEQTGAVDRLLEAHRRTYTVNALLSALNWRITASGNVAPTLIPEAQAFSLRDETTRFLDYLGLEESTLKPLLVVEAKRPSEGLPGVTRLPVPDTPGDVIVRGLMGESLTGKWNKWLGDVRDYVRSITHSATTPPLRVCITNGSWVVIFLDVVNSFLDGGAPEKGRVLVYEDEDALERGFSEVFLSLEYGRVLGQAPCLESSEVPFYLKTEDLKRSMLGLRLIHICETRNYSTVPVIVVSPVLFLYSRYGAWFRVENQRDENQYPLPHDTTLLEEHFSDVSEGARDLLGDVERVMLAPLTLSPLTEHYGDEESFASLRGVTAVSANRFLVVTGDKPHYLLPTPTVANCPYHSWGDSRADGVATSDQILRRSIDPKAFFYSPEVHHCAHRHVVAPKGSPISEENRARCGSRSGDVGSAFCEIWRFEQYLCCRTCIFQDVCTKADVFRLPCERT